MCPYPGDLLYNSMGECDHKNNQRILQFLETARSLFRRKQKIIVLVISHGRNTARGVCVFPWFHSTYVPVSGFEWNRYNCFRLLPL